MRSRRKRSSEKQARREKIRELFQSSGVSSMEDIQNLFKETIAECMENGLDAELDEELSYRYATVDESAARDALDTFSERWDKKYPRISQSWRDNWANLSAYFKYPQEVRRLISITNTMEGFNRQLQKVTKSRSVFPTDDSLLKMLDLAMIDIFTP